MLIALILISKLQSFNTVFVQALHAEYCTQTEFLKKAFSKFDMMFISYFCKPSPVSVFVTVRGKVDVFAFSGTEKMEGCLVPL